ncbi:hypothetical protein FRB94_014585 [Tulasnella sp. JGI-2019a]|nr:hypothetical protein FRB94_014585 [Tulasnella sp. JGI-2019a]KAG9017367.1 hypothetical protein FRB93_007481 [Tulasnella sp. JGI-2019a]
MLQLPPELIVTTLSHATLIDVICKTLDTIINESTVLQYLIELGCAGYVDGNYDKGTLQQHERLGRLIEVESAWRRFSLETKMKLKMSGLDILRFSSIFEDMTSETWNLAHTQPAVKAVCDVTIDPGSDLLLLVEYRDEDEGIDGGSWIYDFHIRSLSTCLPHPAARQSVITHSTPHEIGIIATTVIVEDFFLVILSCISRDDESGELIVWNWKTGKKVACLKGSFPSVATCTFLSPTVFVVPQTSQTAEETLKAYLAVYAIPSSEEGGVATPCLLAIYNFPVFSPKVVQCAMVVQFNPVPYPRNVAQAGDGFGKNPIRQSFSKPFYVDPLKRIFVIGMEAIYRRSSVMSQTEGFTVFLHSDAFIKLLGEQTVRTGLPSKSTGKNFKWDEYSKYARMTEHRPRKALRYLDYIEDRLHIWDFSPYPANRKQPLTRASFGDDQEETVTFNKGGEECSTSANDDRYMLNARPIGRRPAGLTESNWTSPRPAVIENAVSQHKVWSSLPYQRVTSRTKFDDLDSVMMDDERIILFKLGGRYA